MPSRTDKHIWGLFAGRCAMCKKVLVLDTQEHGRSLVGDIAHIVGHRPTAARHNPSLDYSQLKEPDNLVLLCKEHHKQVDDNPTIFTVEELHDMRTSHLNWIEESLEPASPWKLSVSDFTFINLPRLHEYAMLNGYYLRIPDLQPTQSLRDLGLDLLKVMQGCRNTLNNMSIASISIENVLFPHENYIGSLINFERLRFRTKNIDISYQSHTNQSEFAGNLDVDPHIYHDFGSWKLAINIDTRWITTSTARTMFRPRGGHMLFSGFARLNQVDLEEGVIIATALVLGVPTALTNRHNQEQTNTGGEDLEYLEDEVTKGRQECWVGHLDCCDICGKDFSYATYMIDGPEKFSGPWANMCVMCYLRNRLPLGIGKGQLYRKKGRKWILVGGYAEEKQIEQW